MKDRNNKDNHCQIKTDLSKLFGLVIRGFFIICAGYILCVVWGGQESYRGNKALLNSVEISALIIIAAVIFILSNKILKHRTPLKLNIDRWVLRFITSLWFISLYVFYNIYFKTGWDVWTIDYAARVLIGKNDYIDWLTLFYGNYSNNIVLTYLYAACLKINELFGVLDVENGLMVFVGFNLLMSYSAAGLVYYCLKKLINRKAAILGGGG